MLNPNRMLQWCSSLQRPAKKTLPGIGTLWILHHPDHIAAVTGEDEDSFSKGGELWAKVKDFLGERSLITVESAPRQNRKGSKWAELRMQAMQTLEGVNRSQIEEVAQRVTRELHLRLLVSGGCAEVDLRDIAMSFTGQLMLSVLDVPTEHQWEVLNLTTEGMGMLTGQMVRGFIPLGDWLPSSRRFRAICKRLTELLGNKRDLVVTLLVAGRDTTASAIVSAIREPTLTTEEAFAKWPPIYWFPRIARSPVLIGRHPEDTIEPNDTVIIFPYGTYHLHQRTDFAFGWGVRRCAGMRLAHRMTQALVSELRSRFDIEPIGPNEAEGGITLWQKHRSAVLRLSNNQHA